jgi:hypothetical protein
MISLPPWLARALTTGPEDSADLRWAIETAAAMWSRGDWDGSVNWLERAALEARSGGRSDRAADLADAADELKRHLVERGAPTVAMQAPIPEPSIPQTKVASHARVRTAPYVVGPDDITKFGEPSPAQLEASRRPDDTDPTAAPVPGSVDNEPIIRDGFERPRPPQSVRDLEPTLSEVHPVRREVLEPTVVMDEELAAAIASGAAAPALSPSAALAPEPAAEPAAPSPQPSDSPLAASSAPTTLESPHGPLEPMRALRVAVHPGGAELSVRLLADGEPAPAGTQEALLIALGAGGMPTQG